MSRTTFAVESIVGGVSQQPDSIKLPSQCKELINGIPSVIEGLKKRAPSEFIGLIDGTGTALPDGRLWSIYRDKDEKYLVVYTDGALRIFGFDGVEYGIYSSSGFSPDWSYLAGVDAQDIRLLNVADYTFVLNTTKPVSIANSPIDQQDTYVGHAYVSIVQGNYSTNYQITLDPLPASYDPVSFITRTWKGDGPAAKAATSKYRVMFKIGEVGNPGDTWQLSYVDYNGVTQTLTENVPATGSTTELANLFRADFDADAKLNVSGVQTTGGGGWRYFTVEATEAQDASSSLWDLTLTQVTKPATAADTLLQVLEEPNVAELQSIQTREIALDLAKKINASGSLFTAEAFEHVLKITAPVQFDLDVSDTSNGTLLIPCNRKVNDFSELPTRCTDGYGVRVVGSTKGVEDDYWVRFSIETSTGLDLGGFGKGTWEEDLPLYPLGTIQGSDGFQRSFYTPNMPWQLVRRFDGGGFVYFTWEEVDWALRSVGDLEMNPFPGFVGGTIEDIVFHRNRLGLLSGSKINFSEAGEYFNFWRTSVRELLDSDPIELESNLRNVIAFRHAVEVDGELLLFSDKAAVKLEADPVLTPSTGALRPALTLSTDTQRPPEVVGRTVLVPTTRGSYSGVQEVYRADDVNYGFYDLTEQIPHYILGSIKDITSCTQENRVVFLADDGSLYLNCYFFSGNEKVQSAWSKLQLADGLVLGCTFIDTDLYLLVYRDGYYDLERMRFATGLKDGTYDAQVCLDRRVDTSGLDLDYDSGTNRTAINLPYYAPTTATFKVVRQDTWAPLAVVDQDLSTPGAQVLYITGDYTSIPCWLGLEYPMTWELAQVQMRQQTSRGSSRGVLSGRTVVQYGTLALKDSGAAKVTVEASYGPTDTYWWNPGSVGSLSIFASEAKLGTESFQFPVKQRGDEASVTVESGNYLPLAIVGMEWEIDYFTRSRRM